MSSQRRSPSAFERAFAEARARGDKTFEFTTASGKKGTYGTRLKGEDTSKYEKNLAEKARIRSSNIQSQEDSYSMPAISREADLETVAGYGRSPTNTEVDIQERTDVYEKPSRLYAERKTGGKIGRGCGAAMRGGGAVMRKGRK
jgi:hypothetical protein